MRLNSILFLPTSILTLLAAHAASAEPVQEEHNPTPWKQSTGAERPPKESLHRRREVEEHLRLGKTPVGVMKMSPDEGEKFYMEYWQFENDLRQSPSRDLSTEPLLERDVSGTNGSAAISFNPPFALHIGSFAPRDIGGASVLAALEKRAPSCPTGTKECSSIGRPNSCCSTGDECFIIQDTGLGSVGCCPKGNTCAGTISQCNVPNSPCPSSLGGGCCIPNYECEGLGCVLNSTVVVPQPPATSASPSTEIHTSTTSSAIPPSTSATTTTSRSSSLPNTPSTVASSTVSTDTGAIPLRPTSGTSITTTTSMPAGPTDTLCPTGFYACSAYYQGGCCRVGRNCEKTSCPATSSTTIISSGRTVVVPVGPAATVNSPTGACATGWSSCAASDGGNCCPEGYQCGTASCSSISPSSTAKVQKASPNLGARNGIDIGVSTVVLVIFVLAML